MCGIVGYIGIEDNGGLARAMADTIRHRGPDGDGFHVSGKVALGMRRLSIIDLAGGDQPIFNEDKTIAIVFNGEIYNFRDLRKPTRSARPSLQHQFRYRSHRASVRGPR